MDKIKTLSEKLYSWLSEFGTVYRGVLPNGVVPSSPYMLIYDTLYNFGRNMLFTVNIYEHNTTSYVGIVTIADAIENAVKGAGYVINDNDGLVIRIEKGTPFYQDRVDESKTTRAGLLNLEITAYYAD